MKLIFLEKKDKGNNIIELFGLPKSGKTTISKKFRKRGFFKFNYDSFSQTEKLIYFLKFFLHNPLKTLYLFFKTNTNWILLRELKLKDYWEIFRMRNSYLLAVLSKYELLKKLKKPCLVDEFFMQSIFMIKQKKSNKAEIEKIISLIPKSPKILLIEVSKKERYNRLSKIKKFARNLNRAYKKRWFENMEFNYQIIKGYLIKNYSKKIVSLQFLNQLASQNNLSSDPMF